MNKNIKRQRHAKLRNLFVDAALGQSWCMEEHCSSKEAFLEAKTNALETCKFVLGLIA